MNAAEKIRKKLPDGQTAALIVSPHNRRYLTGWESSDGYVLITPEKARFLTDFRYIEAARQQVREMESCLCGRLSVTATPFLKEEGIERLLVEREDTTLAQFAALEQGFPAAEIVGDGSLDVWLKELRQQKTPEELACIRRAQRLTDEGFSYILSRLSVGRTEREVALDLEFFMRRKGADSVSFDFIVVAGENSSKPHGVPGDRVLRRGDFVTMDFGATVDGYHSDMTRTIAIGTVSEEQAQVYETVLHAQTTALGALKAGLACRAADAAARDIIIRAGYGEAFGHSTGHGVGLEIHEAPNLSPRSETILHAGNVVTVEPGIYLPGKFGVRIEDMAVITEDGCENLTKSPKNLIIV